MSAATTSQVSAKDALVQNSHPAVRHLMVEETDNAVIVSGRVTCYYHKQLAQEALMPVLGRRQLVNRVTVVMDS